MSFPRERTLPQGLLKNPPLGQLGRVKTGTPQMQIECLGPEGGDSRSLGGKNTSKDFRRLVSPRGQGGESDLSVPSIGYREPGAMPGKATVPKLNAYFRKKKLVLSDVRS